MTSRNVPGVYKITNTANGKWYVGQTQHLRQRFSEHRSHLNNNRSLCRYLQHAWNKYGKDSFLFAVMWTDVPINELDLLEQFVLDHCKPDYNLANDASAPMRGKKHSEEAKAKMRLSSRKGKNLSEEHKAKISASHKGKKFSVEHRTNLSKAAKRRMRRPEERAAVSKVHKGKTISKQQREQISRSLVGNKRALGHKHTKETKAKISESLRQRAKKS